MTTTPAPPLHADWADLTLDEDPDRGRFNLLMGPTYLGFLGFTEREDGAMVLQHTIIAEQYGRQGYARALVTLVLDRLRERGKQVVPECSYVQDYLRRFPQYGDLVRS
ncbi:GNAT family N-acetyltransferase [Tersicoccus phoenicis]|uniref:GNAT family N-acetyltransferase n=1 Tax=Tersicoccus phoenicis TaxID=554083 RepID=A0A1R1LNY4_9MICC|nr:GNAT family N-acetyltransferase [Tersicoccus phoenicis]OMH29253.1 GNAT family N-acetyltransferase [Tersicoccus phoenicis]